MNLFIKIIICIVSFLLGILFVELIKWLKNHFTHKKQAPVPITFVIENSDGLEIEIIASEDGVLTLDNLPEGEYIIREKFDNYPQSEAEQKRSAFSFIKKRKR